MEKNYDGREKTENQKLLFVVPLISPHFKKTFLKFRNKKRADISICLFLETREMKKMRTKGPLIECENSIK